MRSERMRQPVNLTKKFSDCVKPEDVPIGTASSVLPESAFLGVDKLKSTSKDLYYLSKVPGSRMFMSPESRSD